MTRIWLEQFDPSTIARGSTIFILGRGVCTGKTELARSLMPQDRQTVVFSRSGDLVAPALGRCEDTADADLPPLCIVLDDYVFEPDFPPAQREDRWENSPHARELLCGRDDLNTELILTSNSMLIQEESLRKKLDYVFFFTHKNMWQLKRTLQLYCLFPHSKFADALLDFPPFHALVIDNVHEQLWWYNAAHK